MELFTPFANVKVIDFFCYPHPLYIISGNNKLNFINENHTEGSALSVHLNVIFLSAFYIL